MAWNSHQYISFEMTWDIETQAKDIQGQLEWYDWANIQTWNLAVQENWPSINEIRTLANENAKKKAEQLANSLWVKLWKLIVYSENWFDWNMYYNSLQNRVYYSSSSLASFNINVKTTVYHTYAIK